MNKCLLVLFSIVSLLSVGCFANETEGVLSVLDQAIRDKKIYDQHKEKRIENLKSLFTDSLSAVQKYYLNESLCREYRKYKLDSAICYAKRNAEAGGIPGNRELAESAWIRLAVLYSSSGRYRESESLLKSIDKNGLPDSLLPDYYEAWCLFFNHYATNVQTDIYDVPTGLYQDSLLSVLKPGTTRYILAKAERDTYRKQTVTAKEDLLRLLKELNPDTPEYAMATYLLGYICQDSGDTEQAIGYFSLSSVADIKNSIKDNASIRMLAAIFYDRGDIDRAYRYVQSAIDDAVFCHVQFRTIGTSEFYTLINTAYQHKESKRKSQLMFYLILISFLSFFLIVAIICVYRQMKRVSNIREELRKTNEKLLELNDDITETNEKLNEKNILLYESNRIKEEYIAHFFDLCSAYINKLENYRRTLNKKAGDGQLDELFRMLKSTTVVDNELEELYANFDRIFIRLYPTFVEDFNALLIDEERVFLKPGEILNTELRIFALIRLGITDSVKIAAFLRYSLSTIYNYRTKARNKAAVSRDGFEKRVMKIGSFSPELPGKKH